jgi:hypothetical protein
MNIVNATVYGYAGGFNGVEMDKEKFQLRHAVDKFFGTEEGWPVIHKEQTSIIDEVKSVLRRWTERDATKANVFLELKRLKLMVCGGTINSIFTNSNINDLDFYMKDPSMLGECKAFLKHYFPDIEIETVNASTYKRKSTRSNKRWTVQLITRFHGEAADIFNWFDFTITHGAYDFETESFVFGDRFFSDLAKRRLVYSGSSMYPICAMYRTKKYVERGYELPGATIMHIALSIVQLKIENYKDLKEQLMGIDTMYLQKLLEAKQPDAHVNYGEFIYEAFQTIDRITGAT